MGILIYETFGEGQEKIGKPKNKNFLLKKGELLKLTESSTNFIMRKSKQLVEKQNLLSKEFYVKMFDRNKIILNHLRAFSTKNKKVVSFLNQVFLLVRNTKIKER